MLLGSGPTLGIRIECLIVSVSLPTRISFTSKRTIFCRSVTSSVSALNRNRVQKSVSVSTNRKQWVWSAVATSSDCNSA